MSLRFSAADVFSCRARLVCVTRRRLLTQKNTKTRKQKRKTKQRDRQTNAEREDVVAGKNEMTSHRPICGPAPLLADDCSPPYVYARKGMKKKERERNREKNGLSAEGEGGWKKVKMVVQRFSTSVPFACPSRREQKRRSSRDDVIRSSNA